jgi:hypothetical protein
MQSKPGISSGPCTADGKSISSRNALKHGLCAKKLTGSDLEFLDAIRARLNDEWEPQTETENMLLAQMALSQWRLERALELELAALAGEINPNALALALRYRTSAERTFFKSLAELQRLRAAIRNDAERELRRERDEEQALIRQLEAQILKPYTPFVSQNGSAPGPKTQFVSQTGSAAVSDHQFVSQNGKIMSER